jgi:hypothetical protein
MKHRIAFAVFAGAVLASTGALAACPAPQNPPAKEHAKAHKAAGDCVDFNGVPQISAQIVAGEPAAAPAKAPNDTAPADPAKPGSPAGLTVGGLAVGLTKPDPGVKPTPTVGYHWSLD